MTKNDKKKTIYNRFWIVVEIISLTISIIISIVIKNTDLFEFYKKYHLYVYNVLCKLNDVFLVSIGIYIAVITFLASSKTPFSDKIKSNKLFEKLGSFILYGIINNLLIIILQAFIFEEFYFILPLFIIAIFSLIYFVEFVFISYSIYNYNIEQLIINSEKEESDYELIITSIDHIDKSLNDINNKLK